MKVERSILLELWNIEISDIKFPNTVFVFQTFSTIEHADTLNPLAKEFVPSQKPNGGTAAVSNREESG